MPTPDIYSFNNVPIPNVLNVSDPFSWRVAETDTPGRDGAWSGAQWAAKRTITIDFTLTANTPSELEAALSDLRAAHFLRGAEAPLVINADKFLYAKCTDLSPASEWMPDNVDCAATYICADPFQYSSTLSTPTIATSGGTFTVAGNTDALPTITLNISAIGSNGLITVTNTTRGESFIIRPKGTGALVIDARLETVRGGGLNRLPWFQGTMPRLSVGSNTLSILALNGASLSSASINYRARSL